MKDLTGGPPVGQVRWHGPLPPWMEPPLSTFFRTLLLALLVGAGLSACTLNLPDRSPPAETPEGG